MDQRLTVAELNEVVRALELKLKDLSQQQLEPHQIIRKHEGAKYFGFKITALNKKIQEGEIPAPVPLSDTGRAMGWFGHQVISHQQKLLAAARAAAEKAATVAPLPKSRAGRQSEAK